MSTSSLLIEGTKYLSATEAGKEFGYTNDYISRLAREGRVAATRVGRQWFVSTPSISEFVDNTKKEKEEKKELLRRERKIERAAAPEVAVRQSTYAPIEQTTRIPHLGALLQSGMLVSVGTLLGTFLFAFVTYGDVTAPLAHVAHSSAAIEQVAKNMYHAPARALTLLVEGTNTARVAFTNENDSRTILPEDMNDAEEGMIIFNGENARSIEEVRQLFSDEVRVERDPESKTGVIRPIFKTEAEDSFRFLMVPVDEAESP